MTLRKNIIWSSVYLASGSLGQIHLNINQITNQNLCSSGHRYLVVICYYQLIFMCKTVASDHLIIHPSIHQGETSNCVLSTLHCIAMFTLKRGASKVRYDEKLA